MNQKKEHNRLLNIIESGFDNITIKPSDTCVLIASNKDGLWAMKNNLKNDNITVKMLRNIANELESNINKLNKN